MPVALDNRPPGTIVIAPLVLVAAIAALSILRPDGLTLPAALNTWFAVWVAICVQALPFLALGVVVSASIAAFVPPDLLRRIVPRDPAGSVVAAGLSGVVLPGCECASVPVAGSLLRRGVPPAAAFTFLLAAPAINPVVLISTAVAFSGYPMMVIARFLASLFTAWIVGWLWVRFGRSSWIRMTAQHTASAESGWPVFRRTAMHDLLHAGGFLVLGAGIAAAINVLLPQRYLDGLAGSALRAVLVMGLLAVLVSICSEADAFVAASLTAFSPTAQLVFMTVSPMVDLKLISMQAGTFGPGFAARFAPVTFVVAVFAATGVAAAVRL
jgi:uncharacterized membrane protein YraQ (UPF0718 family)